MKRVSRKLTRVLAMILVLAFALSAMASAAWVEISNTLTATVTVTPKAEEVAEVNGEKFTDFYKALEAAKTQNQTLKLLTNIELVGPTEDNEAYGRIEVTEGVTLEIDLNGHSISRSITPICVNGGKLEVTGEGTITETEDNGYSAIMIYGSTENTEEDYSYVKINEGVTLKGWAGIFINKNTQKTAYGVTVDFNGTIDVVNPDHAAGNAFYINGTIQHSENAPVITIGPNAVIKAKPTDEGTAIYAAGYTEMTINGGTFEGDNAMEAKAGKITINGGTFIAQGEKTEGSNNNGTSTQGYALAVVDNKNYGPSLNVTVNGGTFNGPVGIVEDNPRGNATLTINSGTFKNDVTDYVSHGNVVIGAVNDDGEYDNYKVVELTQDAIKLSWVVEEEGESLGEDGTLTLDAVKGETKNISVKAELNPDFSTEGTITQIKNVLFVMTEDPDSKGADSSNFTAIGNSNGTQYELGYVSNENEKYWYWGPATGFTFKDTATTTFTFTFNEEGKYIFNIRAVQLEY